MEQSSTRKHEESREISIPCALQELNRTRKIDFKSKEKDELLYYADKSEKTRKRILFTRSTPFRYRFSSKDILLVAVPTTHSDDPTPVSSPVKTKGLAEENFQEGCPEIKIPTFPISSLLTLIPLSDKDELFALKTIMMRSDDFSSYRRMNREFEEYLSDPTQEEIDILLVPDNLIPPGVEDADSEDEVNKRHHNLDPQDVYPSISFEPSTPEPPDIEKCFEPKAGILIIKEFKGVSKSHIL
ncbi:hypothetical protein Tco_0072365 [Tanacetum coccineum]